MTMGRRAQAGQRGKDKRSAREGGTWLAQVAPFPPSIPTLALPHRATQSPCHQNKDRYGQEKRQHRARTEKNGRKDMRRRARNDADREIQAILAVLVDFTHII